MRLSDYEQETIVREAEKHFGSGSRVILFGSRTDDTKKGGDIDLLIIPEMHEDLYMKRVRFLVSVKTEIGDQKIDAIIEQQNDQRSIVKTAKSEGIILNKRISMKTPQTEKLVRITDTCKLHLDRLKTAFHSVHSLLPLNREKLLEMNSTQRAFIDQYIFRFAKLQDTIGEKLFKETLNALGENTEGMTFIDIFNRLESLNIITDLERWRELRQIRNDVSHDYPIIIEETIESLNKILGKETELEIYFTSVFDYLKERNLV